MKLPLILSLLASCAVVVGVTSAAEHLEAVASAGQTEWTFRYAGQPVMVYAFAPWSYKPYVKVLSTIEGEDLLRDAPHDHLHHHALMYAIRVNGLNFWEEISGSGVEKPVKTDRPELGHTAAGLPEARLHQVLHWLAPQDAFLPDSAAVALLIEDRTQASRFSQWARVVSVRPPAMTCDSPFFGTSVTRSTPDAQSVSSTNVPASPRMVGGD